MCERADLWRIPRSRFGSRRASRVRRGSYRREYRDFSFGIRPRDTRAAVSATTRTGQPAVWRKQPYELSPPGDKYLVWVDGLDHGYGGATGAGWFNPRNKPNADHVAWTRAVTTAFWQAYLEKDDVALAWLHTDRLAALSRGAATVEHK